VRAGARAEGHLSARARQVGGVHYRKHRIQPWDAMAEWFTPEEFRGFLKGSALKYIARERDKGGLVDLQKAHHYLETLIEAESRRRRPKSRKRRRRTSAHAK
jgi:hypothetical protein